jgi:hypothetical protein
VFQGAGVSDTIRSGITNIEFFTPRPDILAYGAFQQLLRFTFCRLFTKLLLNLAVGLV